MSFIGFENVGQSIGGPLADAQLKEAYADYKHQQELQQMERQYVHDKIAEQQAAEAFGYNSPRIERIPLDPMSARFLGSQLGVDPRQYNVPVPIANENPLAPQRDIVGEIKQAAGEAGLMGQEDFSGNRSPDSEATPRPNRMDPYVQELFRQYPELVDSEGKVHPYFAKKLEERNALNAKLEADAAMLSGRSIADMLKQKRMNELKLQQIELQNASREKIQSMRGESSKEVQGLRNQGLIEQENIRDKSRTKGAEIKAQSSIKAREMQEGGLNYRKGLEVGSKSEIQKMKDEAQLLRQERQSIADYVKQLGALESAQKIAEGKNLTQKEIEEIRAKNAQAVRGMQEKGLTKREKIKSAKDVEIEKLGINAGKYKKYPPSGGRGSSAGARPLPYKKDAYEESLLKEIDGYNKIKGLLTSSPKEKAQAQEGIVDAQRRLQQYRSGGGSGIVSEMTGITAQEFKPKGAPQSYYDWLKKFNVKPSPKNWEQFQKKGK